MTNKFLIGPVILAFCFIIALPALAQDPPKTEEKGRLPRIIGLEPPPIIITPEKEALIKELLGLMNASNNSEAIANQIMDQLEALVARQFSNEMRGWIKAQKFPLDEQKRLEAIVDETIQRILTRIRDELPKRVNFSELVEKIGIEIYNRHFTEAEVKDLIAFYKTSTGQKFVKVLPQITSEIIPELAKSIPPEPTRFAGELLEKIAIEAYNRHLTEAEVKDLITFNKTSTAQKFARIRQQIILEMMSGVERSLAPELVPLINKIFENELSKLIPKRN
jgi:hypothetical protein